MSFMYSLKKFCLIALFSFSHMFMPFIFVNCGEDLAYDRTATAEEELGTELDENVSDCDLNEFLVADCVEEEQAENDDDFDDEDDSDTTDDGYDE